MTQREGTDEVRALEQARARLEAALSGNASWRALRTGAGGSNRDRLERELADNPLYRSWKLVNEAIDSLRSAEEQTESLERQRQRGAAGSTAGDDLTRIRGVTPDLARGLAALGITRYGEIAAWRSEDVHRVSAALELGRAISRQNWIEQAALLQRIDARTEARAIDLPDILEHIRNEGASRGGAPAAVSLDRKDKAADEPVPTHSEPPRRALDDAPATSRSAAPQGSPIPTVAASSHVNTGAAERVKGLEEERRQRPAGIESAGAGWVGRESDETSVIFVIREPVEAASPTGDAPTAQSAPLFQAAAGATGEASTRQTYASPAEEAEVVIASTGGGQANVGADDRSRPVRRLIRSLMGN